MSDEGVSGDRRDDARRWDCPPIVPVDEYAVDPPPTRAPLDWNVRWPERPGEPYLRARVGTSADGEPVELEFKAGKGTKRRPLELPWCQF